ncbi:MAG: hypothetical protein R2747_05815 [Pyrinomonadaceae bacterium]
MAKKLNQIIAIEKGAKNRIYSKITDLHKQAQKADQYYGFNKAYEPKDENGEQFPPEQKKVVLRSDEVLEELKDLLTEIMDITATKDFANMSAAADIKVGGKALAKKVPVPYLLFLEKQLTDLRTFVDKMPVLDEGEDWSKDDVTGLFKTDPISKHRTQKVSEAIVLYDATKEHPAQTQLITKDVTVGHWREVKQSGAITRAEKRKILERVESVLNAVKSAREEANGAEAPEKNIGADLLGYIFS